MGRAYLSQLGENVVFKGGYLGHGFDDKVDGGERGERCAAC